MTPEHRRQLYAKIVARWAARGLVLDASPAFLGSVQDWIEGRISMEELRQRYDDLLRDGMKGSQYRADEIAPQSSELPSRCDSRQ
jgi:hypothetical protein